MKAGNWKLETGSPQTSSPAAGEAAAAQVSRVKFQGSAKLKLRLSKELHGRACAAREAHGVEVAEIVRRALRKWGRQGVGIKSDTARVALAEYADSATRDGSTVITIEVPAALREGMTSREMATILGWYLSLPWAAPPPRFVPPAEEQFLVEVSGD